MNRQELLEMTQQARKTIEEQVDFKEEYDVVMKRCTNAAQKGEQSCFVRVGQLDASYEANLRLKLLIEKLEQDGLAVSKTVPESGNIYLKVVW